MKKFYFFFLLLASTCLNAQFSGPYAVANWTLTNSPGANGSVNTAGAPASLILNGSDDELNIGDVTVDYTIITTATGNWSFNWSYTTSDGPNFDPAGVLVNGVFTQLTNNDGGMMQSGTFNGGSVTSGSTIGFRVRSLDNAAGNGVLTISNFSAPGMILPITLSYFKIGQSKQGMDLSWKSASEVNAKHFEIERGTEANSFIKIGTVNALGEEMEYFFRDELPANGINYYRLKMVDADGSFKYSTTLVVKHSADESFKVYPNPSRSELFFQLQLNEGATEMVQVFNVAGEMVYAKTIEPNTSGTYKIETGHLQPGIYFIKLKSGMASTFQKL